MGTTARIQAPGGWNEDEDFAAGWQVIGGGDTATARIRRRGSFDQCQKAQKHVQACKKYDTEDKA